MSRAEAIRGILALADALEDDAWALASAGVAAEDPTERSAAANKAIAKLEKADRIRSYASAYGESEP